MDKEDHYLWEVAKARVSFRIHWVVYVVVNILFWIIWYNISTDIETQSPVPWPIYPFLGWGIGLLFHYLFAYQKIGGRAMMKEFEELKKSKRKNH